MHKLAERRIIAGVQDLSSVANERAFHVVQVMSVAVEILVWAAQEDIGKDTSH